MGADSHAAPTNGIDQAKMDEPHDSAPLCNLCPARGPEPAGEESAPQCIVFISGARSMGPGWAILKD